MNSWLSLSLLLNIKFNALTGFSSRCNRSKLDNICLLNEQHFTLILVITHITANLFTHPTTLSLCKKITEMINKKIIAATLTPAWHRDHLLKLGCSLRRNERIILAGGIEETEKNVELEEGEGETAGVQNGRCGKSRRGRLMKR